MKKLAVLGAILVLCLSITSVFATATDTISEESINVAEGFKKTADNLIEKVENEVKLVRLVPLESNTNGANYYWVNNETSIADNEECNLTVFLFDKPFEDGFECIVGKPDNNSKRECSLDGNNYSFEVLTTAEVIDKVLLWINTSSVDHEILIQLTVELNRYNSRVEKLEALGNSIPRSFPTDGTDLPKSTSSQGDPDANVTNNFKNFFTPIVFIGLLIFVTLGFIAFSNAKSLKPLKRLEHLSALNSPGGSQNILDQLAALNGAISALMAAMTSSLDKVGKTLSEKDDNSKFEKQLTSVQVDMSDMKKSLANLDAKVSANLSSSSYERSSADAVERFNSELAQKNGEFEELKVGIEAAEIATSFEYIMRQIGSRTSDSLYKSEWNKLGYSIEYVTLTNDDSQIIANRSYATDEPFAVVKKNGSSGDRWWGILSHSIFTDKTTSELGRVENIQSKVKALFGDQLRTGFMFAKPAQFIQNGGKYEMEGEGCVKNPR